jgi:hypothetical protein
LHSYLKYEHRFIFQENCKTLVGIIDLEGELVVINDYLFTMLDAEYASLAVPENTFSLFTCLFVTDVILFGAWQYIKRL